MLLDHSLQTLIIENSLQEALNVITKKWSNNFFQRDLNIIKDLFLKSAYYYQTIPSKGR